MKKHAIYLTIAGAMTLQSAGMAGAQTTAKDRTAGVGDTAISTAQSNLKTVADQLTLLDQSLSVAEQSILARDKQTAGKVLNGTAVVGAGIGVGLAAASRFFGAIGGEGSGIGVIAFGLIGAGTSALSAISGATGVWVRTDVDIKETEAKLKTAQQDISSTIAATADKATVSSLRQLLLSVGNAQTAIEAYKNRKSDVTRNKVASEVTQVLGAAMITFAATGKNREAMFKYGAYVMAIGGVGSVVSGMQDSQAEAVLKEIRNTRDAVRNVANSLK